MKTEIMSLEQFEEIKGNKAIDIVTDIKNAQPLIDHVKKQASAVVGLDMSIKKNRDLVGTAQSNVSKSKKAIIAVIDRATADINRKLALSKEFKKHISEKCDEIRKDTLKERDEWQAEQDRIEEERVSAIRERVANITAIGALSGSESIETLQGMVEAIEAMEISADSFSEFSGEALDAKQAVLKALNDAMYIAIQNKQAEETRRKLEEQRKAAEIEAKINNLRQMPMQFMIGANASQIRAKIAELSDFTITESYFGDRSSEAQQAMDLVLVQLGQLAEQAEKLEAASVPEKSPEVKEPELSDHIYTYDPEHGQTTAAYDPAAAATVSSPSYEPQKHDTSRKLPSSGHFKIESTPEDIAARKAAAQIAYMIESITDYQAATVIALVREGKIPHVQFSA